MENIPLQKRRFLLPILILVLAAVLILLFFSFRVCEFVGSSMAPILRDGDLVLFQTWGYTPRQGDIVLLEKPNFPPPPQRSAPIVKRVVAVGGQHIRIDYGTNTVYVDGTALEEPYVLEPMTDLRAPEMTVLDVVVPYDSVYVLGDNRNHSSDSRHQDLGCVPTEYLLGKAVYRFH